LSLCCGGPNSNENLIGLRGDEQTDTGAIDAVIFSRGILRNDCAGFGRWVRKHRDVAEVEMGFANG